MNRLFGKLLFSPFLLISLICAQDLSSYFDLVNQGKYEEVRSAVSTLKTKYPNNPAVMYLDALSRERAEDAMIIYKMIVQRHPNSDYADDAVMKVGEYLYARGLYSQASRQLLRVPKSYPRSEHVQRAIDLQINALLASGEKDSARFYVQVYQKRFPRMRLDYNFEPDKPVVVRSLEANVERVAPKREREQTPAPAVKVAREAIPGKEPATMREPPGAAPKQQVIPRPFVVQVGAYGSVKNALRQKELLEHAGYEVELHEITSRGRNLHAVQVVRYATRAKADEVGKRLKAKLGYNYFVAKRPE